MIAITPYIDRPRNERLLIVGTFLTAFGFMAFIVAAFLCGTVHEVWWGKAFLPGAFLLLGVCLFCAVCRWPELLLHLMLVGVILDQWEAVGALGIPYLTLSKALMLLALFILVARPLLARNKPPSLLFPTAALAHLPFSFVCLVSTLAFSYSYRSSFRWLLAPLLLPVMAIILSQFIEGQKNAVRLVKTFALFSFFPMFVAGLEVLSHVHVMGPAELVSYGANNIFRVAGNFENPNDFVTLMLFSIPLLLLWVFQTESRISRLFLLAGAALQGAVLLKTYSRSGYVSMGVTFVALVFLARKRIRWTAVACCIFGIAAFLTLPDVRDRILTLFGIRAGTVGLSQAFGSINLRKILMVAAWNEFLHHPVLGIGFANLGARVKHYSTLAEGITAENTYLQVLAEMGLVGFSAYLFFLLSAWKAMMTGLKQCRGNRKIEPLFVALAAGYCGFAFNSLLDTNLADNLPWVLLPIMVFLSPGGKISGCRKSP